MRTGGKVRESLAVRDPILATRRGAPKRQRPQQACPLPHHSDKAGGSHPTQK